MMKGSLQRKLTVALVAVAVASVVLVGLGVWFVASVGARDDARERLAEQVEAFEEVTEGAIVLRARSAVVVERFAAAFDVDDLGFVAIDDAGTVEVLAGLASVPTLRLDEGEMARLDAGETVFVDRPVRVVAVRLLEVGGPRSAATTGRTAVVITDRVAPLSGQLRRWFLVSATGVSLLAVAVGGVLARRLAAPLEAIEQTTEALAGGRLDARVDIGGRAADDEIARLARSVNSMASDLERSRALERQFLLSVSHDLRTPMTAIRGWAEMLQDGGSSEPAEVRRAGAVIDRQARRLDRLISDLLDLARLDSRQFPLEREPVDLGAVAQESVEGHGPSAEADGISLSSTATGSVLVEGDRDRLSQVVGNLLDNALKYATAQVSVVVENVGGRAVLTVADDGPGISAEDLPHVFERLYVTQRAPRRAEQSSGLGLAIVRELVSAMGGTVEVRSPAPGDSGPTTSPTAWTGGTALTVTLPALGVRPQG